MKPCEVCDELSEQSRCDEHRPKPKPKPKAKQAGYDAAWKKLSARARKAQPFCLWCGSDRDLQLDHTPAAWERKAQHLPIRLQDVRVLCGACNRAAGQARPGPGQRTSEDRPAPVMHLPVTGRLVTPAGGGWKASSSSPVARQDVRYSPDVPTEHAQGSPW